ncbi:MAG: DUF885 domain-containing protein, partial [Oxalobacteraceae bacterium]
MKPILKLGAIVAASLIACAPAGAAQSTAKPASAGTAASPASKQLARLGDDYWNAQARFDPVMAGEAGDPRFPDQIGMSIAPDKRARQFALYQEMLKRLHAIRRDGLAQRDQTSYDILDFDLRTTLRMEAFPEYLLPLNQMDAMPVTLANYSS